MKILLMGGTRFVGKALVKEFLEQGHEITLFTRGKNPIPNNVEHIVGDRNSDSISQLKGMKYDVIVDSSGRKLEETRKVLKYTGNPLYRFIYISSAGIYKNSEEYPYKENSLIDNESRHYGKVETEQWLIKQELDFTSFRPTYIYGPGNYNPIESWFFDRITNNIPIPLPGEGQTITQLGHVKDLAKAICKSLGSSIAKNKIYNCSGEKSISILGLIRVACKVCEKDSSTIKLKSFDPSKIDGKARKLFPIRLNHFMTDINLIKSDLKWKPEFDLYTGLKDSYINDYLIHKNNRNLDFSADNRLFNK